MKQRVIVIVCSLLVGYVAGRYGHPVKVTETKVVEVQIEKQDKSQIIKVETVKPDGTRITKTRTKKDVVTDTDKRTEAVKVVENTARFSIAGLAGLHAGQVLYGAALVSKVAGPVELGAFILTNGTAGVSLGVGF